MIKCDKCSHEFELKASKIKTRIQGDLHVQYFRCPECNEVYVALVTDSKLRKMIKLGIGRNKEALDYSKEADLKSRVNYKQLK